MNAISVQDTTINTVHPLEAIAMLPAGGFRGGKDELPPGGFRGGEDELPPGGFRG